MFNKTSNNNDHKQRKYCKHCAANRKSFIAVHSHDESNCRLKKAHEAKNQTKNKKQSEQLHTMVAKIYKKLKDNRSME